MSLPMMVYLIGMLKPLTSFLVFLIAASLVVPSFYILCLLINTNSIKGINYKFITCFYSMAILFCITQVVIPTEKTAYMMVAAYATQKVYEAPETAKIQEKVLTLINQKLDSFIDDKDDKKVNKE